MFDAATQGRFHRHRRLDCVDPKYERIATDRNAADPVAPGFEESRGQLDVRFRARGAGYAFFVTNGEAVGVLHSEAKIGPAAVVRMDWLDRLRRLSGGQLVRCSPSAVLGSFSRRASSFRITASSGRRGVAAAGSGA
jgi:hypothetical protein